MVHALVEVPWVVTWLPLLEACLQWIPPARETMKYIEGPANSCHPRRPLCHGRTMLERGRRRAMTSRRPRRAMLGKAPARPPPGKISAMLQLPIHESLLPTWQPQLDSERKRKGSKLPRRCSGHCNTSGHRYKRHCLDYVQALGAKYCPSCVCALTGCGRPLNKGDFCYKHAGQFDELHWALHAARAAHAVLPD